MSVDNINILFYSSKCSTCELFMKHCKNNDVLKHFKLICIEESVGKLPSSLKVVPSILVKGQLIEGKQTFEWLKGLLEFKKSSKSNFVSDSSDNKNSEKFDAKKDNVNNTNNKQAVNNPKEIKKNLLDFTIKELTGISDEYAYLQVDSAQPKAFLQYGADKEHAIYTAPESGKINKKQQDTLINKYSSERTTDQNTFENKIKKVHDEIMRSKLKK